MLALCLVSPREPFACGNLEVRSVEHANVDAVWVNQGFGADVEDHTF